MVNQSFSKINKLTCPSQFNVVFSDCELRIQFKGFIVLAKKTNHENSRLGLVIAKKNLPLAAQRNKLKRIVRETFRKNRFSQSVDVVFLAQKGIAKYPFSDLNEMLAEAWSNLQKKLQKYD